MGKLISESRAEIEKCAWVCDYYAENGELFLKDELIEAGYTKSLVSFEPIGAGAGHHALELSFLAGVPLCGATLMAGNVCLLKHAPNVCGCSLAIEKGIPGSRRRFRRLYQPDRGRSGSGKNNSFSVCSGGDHYRQ